MTDTRALDAGRATLPESGVGAEKERERKQVDEIIELDDETGDAIEQEDHPAGAANACIVDISLSISLKKLRTRIKNIFSDRYQDIDTFRSSKVIFYCP